MIEEPLDIPVGFHMHNGMYIRVTESATSGYLYAEEYTASRNDWEYTGRRGLEGLSFDTLLTPEQAKAFAMRFGKCVYCGRKLRDEQSVERGYGPICARNHGLPWEKTLKSFALRVQLSKEDVDIIDELRGDVSRPQWVRRAVLERRDREMSS